MIVGWFFMVSNQLINSDSNYKYMKSIIEGWLEASPNDMFVIFMPYSKNMKYAEDGFFKKHGRRVLPVLYKCPSQKTRAVLFFNGDFIYEQTKNLGISVYFNNIPEIGAQLSCIYANFLASNPLVVNYNPYTIHPTLPYAMKAYAPLRVLASLGNYFGDLNLFLSEYSHNMFRDTTKEFGLSHWLKTIDEKSAILPVPVLDSEVSQFYKPDKPFKYDPKNILFYYNHRLQSYKNWETTFDLLMSRWNQGYHNFKVNLSYMSGDNIQKATSMYPFIRVVNTHRHVDYYQRLQAPHFNTMNSQHETYCISIIESALLGGIPIIPKAVTFPELFPKDYPFMFKDNEDQAYIIDNILSSGYNPEYLNNIKQSIREHFSKLNSKDIGKQAHNLVNQKYSQLVQRNWNMLKPHIKVKFLKALKKVTTEQTFTEFHTFIKKETGMGNQALPPWRLMTLMEKIPHRKYFKKNKLYIITK